MIATGSIEQPLVFRNNDLPGVMMGSAAQRLIRLYGVKPGARAIVADRQWRRLWRRARSASRRAWRSARRGSARSARPDPRIEAVKAHRLRILAGHTVVEAIPERGKRGISGAAVAQITAEGAFSAKSEAIDCDLLCMAVGYSPAYQLAAHAGVKVGYDERLAMFTLGGPAAAVCMRRAR